MSFGIVVALADLAAAAYLIRRSAARKAHVAALENKIADWEKPVQSWLSFRQHGRAALISEFINLSRGRCQRDREVRAKATHLDDACGFGSQANLGAARKKLAEAAEALRALFEEGGSRR